jgi:hypothetical protein
VRRLRRLEHRRRFDDDGPDRWSDAVAKGQQEAGVPNSWRAWFVVLKALFAIPMDDAELAIFRHHTGRINPPTEPSREAWLLIGRRGGKSFVLAVVAVFLACFYDYTKHLQIGERGRVLILAQDKEHAQIILGYVRGLLNGTLLTVVSLGRTASDGTKRQIPNAKGILILDAGGRYAQVAGRGNRPKFKSPGQLAVPRV